jgi:hypothetical protein
MRTRLVAVLALAASAALPARASAQLDVDHRDGDLGGTVDLVLQAPPGTIYLDILSLTEGPTCFGKKHPVGCIDVDLDFLDLSFLIPGLFGSMGASGELVVTVPLDPDPSLDGIVVNQQMVSLVGGKFTAKSNLSKIVLGFPDTWSWSLSTMAGDPAAIPAIELPDGRLLLAGGGGANLDECEVYETRRQTFTSVAPLAQGRAGHTVTALADGRVLVTGGADAASIVQSGAELYDPATSSWTTVGSLSTPRAGHSAALLADGRVLVIGGTTNVSDPVAAATNSLRSTEYFDPSTLTFAAGPNMTRPHAAHSQVVLANGDVLVCGGGSYHTVFGIPIPDLSNKSQLYVAATNAWATEVNMKAARAYAGSVLLADGRALLAGGIGGSVLSPVQLATSETYDPATNAFTLRGSMSLARTAMTMVVLHSTNLVLVAGGASGTSVTNPLPTDLAETWDPATGLFTAVASLPEPRVGAAGFLQPNHHVILFGGVGVPSAAAIYRD